ncbi:hypothetical protein J5X84_33655 [Streptosporangiaceae bacterium NEAU-GS5]|nr:hypothetical protein [Streptosporangiaceae bacterium NEAU-GS5]
MRTYASTAALALVAGKTATVADNMVSIGINARILIPPPPEHRSFERVSRHLTVVISPLLSGHASTSAAVEVVHHPESALNNAALALVDGVPGHGPK